MKFKMNRNKILYLSLFALFAVFLGVVEIFDIRFSTDSLKHDLIYGIITRIAGALVCLVMVWYCSYVKIFSLKSYSVKGAILLLPCWLVVINNFPFIPYFSGNATLEHGVSFVLLYAIQCICVGIFEEIAFRGCVFMLMLESKHKSKREVFFSIIYSSLVFGAIHIVNLLAGSGIVPVVQQLGYSFLIGAMCAMALILTRNIFTSILLHAVFNFAGGVIPTLGFGDIWDIPTIAITAVLAVLVTAYMFFVFIKYDMSYIEDFFERKRNP